MVVWLPFLGSMFQAVSVNDAMNAAQAIMTGVITVAAFLLKDLHSRISRFMEETRGDLNSFSVRLGQIETKLGMESGVKANDAEYKSSLSHSRFSKRKR